MMEAFSSKAQLVEHEIDLLIGQLSQEEKNQITTLATELESLVNSSPEYKASDISHYLESAQSQVTPAAFRLFQIMFFAECGDHQKAADILLNSCIN